MSTLIKSRLDAVRRKHAGVRAGIGLCTIVIVMVAVLTIEMGLDWFIDLPYTLRAAVLAIHVAALLYLLGRHVIWPLLRGPDDETVALWIEGTFPEAASRIISAVQFARPGAAVAGTSTMMIGQTVREAEEFIQPRDTGEAVATDEMLKRLGIAMLLAVLGIGLFIWGRPNSQDLLKRALAVPGVQVPRKTHVELLSPDPLVIAKGDTVVLAARASGVIPTEGTLRIQYASGAQAEFTMKPLVEDASKFAVSIDNAQDGFTYRVQLNDGRSEKAAVEAHERPSVATISIEQQYPAYTRLKPAKMPTNDLTVLAGSRLAIRVTANEVLKHTRSSEPVFNRVTFSGTDDFSTQSYELRPDPADAKTYLAFDNGQPSVLVPATATGVAVHLIDPLGLESKDDATHPLQVIPDAPPVVKITYPTQVDELVTEKAKTTIGFDLSDDFGLASAALKYRPAGNLAGLSGDGLAAAYFNGDAPQGKPLVQRIEPVIALDFERQPIPTVPHDHFTAQFTGKLNPPVTGLYRFFFHTDDGVRVWIDGQPILDCWGPLSNEVSSDAISLEAGKMVDLRIDYLQLTGACFCQMMWQLPGKSGHDTVPQKNLFSSDDAISKARDKQIKTVELSLGDAAPGATQTAAPISSLRGQYPWEVSALRLSAGDALEWWIEAADANDQTGPGRTQSEHRILRIGTEAQVREALLARLGDYLGTLHDVQENQQDLTAKLGQIILAKPGTDTPDVRQN